MGGQVRRPLVVSVPPRRQTDSSAACGKSAQTQVDRETDLELVPGERPQGV